MIAAGTEPNLKPTSTGLAPNIASLLCYVCLPITSIIFLVIEKEDLDVRFHAWQGTTFGIAYFILLIGLQILAAIMGVIASVLGVIVGFFIPLLWLAAMILWIICLIKAYQGERWKIPVIGDFAAKKAGL
ncbi:MAG: DUF4870 domain-containing protein [Deltaproteobacteria bacterium]|nr:DUF4870 domain-containing protein [Deltaproteobacteria bacterium]